MHSRLLCKTQSPADEVKQEIANPEVLRMRWWLAKTIAEKKEKQIEITVLYCKWK